MERATFSDKWGCPECGETILHWACRYSWSVDGPEIARAAQVQVLREMADELELFMNATRTRSTVGIGWKDGTKEAIKAMRAKAGELEAGGGQADKETH